MQESKLIEGCLQQNRVSQKALYDTYSGQMYSICLRYHKDTYLANEALQRGFIKVFNRLSSFKNHGSLGAWIRSIIVTTSIDLIKEQQKLKFDDLECLTDQSAEWDNDHRSFKSIDYKSLLALLEELPIGYKTVFSLFVLDGISHKEIAKLLEISIATSRSQLYKARVMLKQLLEQKFGKIILENYQ